MTRTDPAAGELKTARWPRPQPIKQDPAQPHPSPDGRGYQLRAKWQQEQWMVTVSGGFAACYGLWLLVALLSNGHGGIDQPDLNLSVPLALLIFSLLVTGVLAGRLRRERRLGQPTLRLEQPALRRGPNVLEYSRVFQPGLRVRYTGTVEARLVRTETTKVGGEDSSSYGVKVLDEYDLGAFPVYEGADGVEAEWLIILPDYVLRASQQDNRRTDWRVQVRHHIPGQLGGITDFVVPLDTGPDAGSTTAR